jgi:hypothetical protein
MSISVKLYGLKEESVGIFFSFFSHTAISLLYREKDETIVKGYIQQKWKTGKAFSLDFPKNISV